MASPLSKNIQKQIRQINNSGIIQPFTNLPNYIPVVNKQTWDYDIYAYYNEYYATAYETQQRRNYRNYLNSVNDIKKSNKNPYTNNQGKKFYFFYTYAQNYMIIENTFKKSLSVYIRINNNWCGMKYYPGKSGCGEVQKIINELKGNSQQQIVDGSIVI
jgi:hypothetical protein